MTTIKDVAKHARVSITSASYALNGTGTISAATRKRVLEAAEKLNYHPNAFARHLKKRKTLTIGVFINAFGGSFYDEILEGIHAATLQTDYELIVCPVSRAVRKILVQRQVDGAILFDSSLKSDLIVRLASKRFPLVVMDRYLEADYLFPLLLDNRQGAQAVFAHLYDQGARRIAFVSGVPDTFDNLERMQAFVGAADQHQLHIQCHTGNFTEASGYEIASTLLAAGPLPEAVFCANDQMAIGFIRALQARQRQVPHDLAVVGFDDILLSRYMRPSLTTVGTSRFQWGALAASQLIGFLENESAVQTDRIPTRLIARESSVLRLAAPAAA